MNVVSAFLIYSAVLFSGMERASHTAPAATKDFIILKVEIVSGLNELNMNVYIKKKNALVALPHLLNFVTAEYVILVR